MCVCPLCHTCFFVYFCTCILVCTVPPTFRAMRWSARDSRGFAVKDCNLSRIRSILFVVLCMSTGMGWSVGCELSLSCLSVGRSVCLSLFYVARAVACSRGSSRRRTSSTVHDQLRSFAFIYPLSVSLLFVTTCNVPFGHFPDPFHNFDVLLLSGLEEHPETSNCMGCSKYIGEVTTVRLTSPKRICVVCIL